MKKKSNLVRLGLVNYTLVEICFLMVILIGAQFQTEKPANGLIYPTQADNPNDLIITPVNITNDAVNISAATEPTTENKPNIVINPVSQTEEPQGQAVSVGINQTIQPDVVKPAPSEDQLTDPTQTPNGIKIDTPPPEDLTDIDNKPPDAVIPATTEKPQPDPNQPKAGDKQNGKIYIPGFGWIENHGGGGEGIQADDMFENGNKIGFMG